MFKKAMIAGAVLAAAFGAQAQSVPLTVTGTITPGACTIQLGSSGTAAYDTLSSATVKGYTVFNGTNTAYTLPRKNLTMDVTCGSATAVAITATDNRASSMLPLSTNDGNKFGMGKSGTTNIGSYGIFFAGATQGASTTYKATAASTATAPAGYLIRAKGTTGAWTTATGANATNFYPANALAIKQTAADTVPAPLTNISSTLAVLPYVNKALVDSATTEITFDGSATLNLEYI